MNGCRSQVSQQAATEADVPQSSKDGWLVGGRPQPTTLCPQVLLAVGPLARKKTQRKNRTKAPAHNYQCRDPHVSTNAAPSAAATTIVLVRLVRLVDDLGKGLTNYPDECALPPEHVWGGSVPAESWSRPPVVSAPLIQTGGAKQG